MQITIAPALLSEVGELARIQKAAFKPLYERFHDDANPCLRGEEDIVRRLDRSSRLFTICRDGNIVGGICYRLYGKRSPTATLADGEYSLSRIFVDPGSQNLGVARTAILLCEAEFPDARRYYVDFPEELEKNRRCYQSAGYADTGERICSDGAPTLAVYEKTACVTPNVTQPFVFQVGTEQLAECLEVIHQSFSTVAAEFGLTRENCPRHTSFILLSNLENQHSWGWQMFALYAGKRIIGYMSLSNEGGEYELHNLSVLPEYRHRGFGKRLLDYAKSNVAARSGRIIKIGIIEESAILKSWYIANGFVPTGAKKFEHLPFTSGYLEWTPSQG